jgi:5-methylcytosine-specific restriction protein A
MPAKAKRPCRSIGCSVLVASGYCIRHGRKDIERPNATERGYNHQWRKTRLAYLLINPLCAHCLLMEPMRLTPATEVDHIVRHEGNKELFYDQNNLQGLCKSCHSRKTAKEVNLGVR